MSALRDRRKVSKIGPINVDHERSLNQLKQDLRAHHQAIEELAGVLLQFEEIISSSGEGVTTLRPQEVEEQRGTLRDERQDHEGHANHGGVHAGCPRDAARDTADHPVRARPEQLLSHRIPPPG